MENKVYYGEYSLEHWIKLILKGNIVLPDYQRYFVWKKEKSQGLIETLEKNEFIPPVTIGSFKNNGKSVNLILDGQQRLTSILLNYLGIFPDKEHYKKEMEKIESPPDENDNPNEDEKETLDDILEWSLKKLTEKGNDKKEILEKIHKQHPKSYEEIESKSDDFFKTHFLGFSYIVPKDSESKMQQKFYSSVFRNINLQGEILLPQESRAALYYLNNDFVNYFNPEFTKKITVNGLKLDFVRYLALLAQYSKEQNINKVAYGYARRMEKFYEEYIYSVVGVNNSSVFAVFPKEFQNGGYKSIIELIDKSFSSVIEDNDFKSIIDIDVKFFGLLYFIMFQSKRINENKCDSNGLIDKLNNKINDFKNDSYHKRNPGALKHLRARIMSSIDIYREYIDE